MNEFLIIIFQFIVFIFSVMVHEVSHGVVALKLGDETAKKEGRLTLNPLVHIDFFGSILLPIFLVLTSSPVIFGWAKPVPYNPNNLKNPKKGAALIGIAGPLSNIALAVIFGILLRIISGIGVPMSLFPLSMLFQIIISINLLLAVFNLMPIPPLDGSKLLFAILPQKYYKLQVFLERYGMAILLAFIFFGFGFLISIVNFLYNVLVL